MPEASEAFARELTQIFDEREGAESCAAPLVIKGLELMRSGQVAEAHRIVAGSDLQLEVHGTRTGPCFPSSQYITALSGRARAVKSHWAYMLSYMNVEQDTYVNAVATRGCRRSERNRTGSGPSSYGLPRPPDIGGTPQKATVGTRANREPPAFLPLPLPVRADGDTGLFGRHHFLRCHLGLYYWEYSWC